eukprot:TRINITY_DN14424_c0_g3_i1.p1 TRINITY_DN14424_c0_g3~~TRINITY_DN14424_c0_g3_i1.p1  ORF type:complete len:655 (-),score=13.10 TRINITY_DN14424_c0_g3_i1:201-2165(-)
MPAFKLKPKHIAKRFYIAMVLIILIFTLSNVYIYNRSTKRINQDHIEQTRDQVIQSKKEYIKSAVERTFSEIEILEQLLLDNPKYQSDSALFKKVFYEQVRQLIHRTPLKDSGYIWVNEILNYEGGDNFAIRIAHPSLVHEEEKYLSTSYTDIKGNQPYVMALNGLKKDGELFYTYWFKERYSDSISKKLAYAKLYKKYNWIIGTGVYFTDVDQLIQAKLNQNAQNLKKQNTYSILLGFIVILLALLPVLHYRKQIEKILRYYINQVESREKSLESIADEKSRQLTENEKKYLAIYRNNQSIMMLIDPKDGSIVDANKSALKYYGYSFEKITSMKITDINTLPKKEVKDAMHDTEDKNRKYFLFKHRLANNEVRDVEVYSEKMFINGRNLLFSIIHDISELRKTQQALLHAKEKAEESDQLKSAFLANMSHEIRTPMNSILGFTDLLNNPDNTKEQISKYHKIIHTSGGQLLRIIDDIIDISHIEAKQLQITKSDISMNQTLKYIAETFKDNKHKYSNNVELKITIPEDDLIVHTDEIRFCQICNNLLSNAFKNTSKGFIEIGYERIKKSETDHLEIFVKDTGCGIPEDKFEMIFDRFSQNINNEYREGNGLGLSITKGLVELLGGHISLESTVDVGTTFFFTIPESAIKKNQQ